jgi:hypothetical protein
MKPQKIDIKFIEQEISEESKLDEKWVSSMEGMNLMRQFLASRPKNHVLKSDLEGYLLERGLQSPSATTVRSMSSLLTFPLSLGYGLRRIFPQPTSSNLSVLVVGARSESSLPGLWWIETLISCEKIRDIHIGMIGPGLHHPEKEYVPPQPKVFEWKMGGGCDSGRDVLLYHVEKGVNHLHNHEKCMELLRGADVFVCFNPGFGSKPLEKSWESTIRLMLQVLS